MDPRLPAGLTAARVALDRREGPEAALTAGLEAMLAVSPWRPIDTAPKDGSILLGFNLESEKASRPYEFFNWSDDCIDIDDYTSGPGFCTVGLVTPTKCTHWMPLPVAPAT